MDYGFYRGCKYGIESVESGYWAVAFGLSGELIFDEILPYEVLASDDAQMAIDDYLDGQEGEDEQESI